MVQLELEDPYVVIYKQIHAVVDQEGKQVELMERSSCYGGSPGPDIITLEDPWFELSQSGRMVPLHDLDGLG